MIDIEAFESIGLTKREIKVYLALLELGSTSIGAILEKTKIPSSKIYEILNRLQDKGLVSYVKIENKRHYQAADPKSILTFLDEKRERISEAIPELLEKQKFAKKKQSVEMFEGTKAVFNLLRNLIVDAKPKELYLAFTVRGEEHKNAIIRVLYKNFIKKRKEKKLDIRLLGNSKTRQLFEQSYTKKEFQETKLRFTDFNFPQGLTIFRDNIVMVTWGETPTAIKIQSEESSEQFRKFFLQLWKTAK